MKLSFGKMAITAVVAISTTTSILTQATPAKSGPVYVNPTDLQITPGTRGIIQSLTCPDPASTEIKYELISRYSRSSGRVRISGVVKNIGNQSYLSESNQQGVILKEFGRGVKDQPFQNLAPGQEVRVVYERDWNVNAPASSKPKFSIEITYDPDIHNDSNSKNDDCNLANNKFVAPHFFPASIDALFR